MNVVLQNEMYLTMNATKLSDLLESFINAIMIDPEDRVPPEPEYTPKGWTGFVFAIDKEGQKWVVGYDYDDKAFKDFEGNFVDVYRWFDIGFVTK